MDELIDSLGDVIIPILLASVSIFMMSLILRGTIVNAIRDGNGENSVGLAHNQSDNGFTIIEDSIPKKIDLYINNDIPIRIAQGSTNVDFYSYATYYNEAWVKRTFSVNDDYYVTNKRTYPNIQVYVVNNETGLYDNSFLVNGVQSYVDVNTFMKDKLNNKGLYTLKYYTYNQYGMVTSKEVNVIID